MKKNFYTLFLLKRDLMIRGLMSGALYAIECSFPIFHFEMKEFPHEIMEKFYMEHKSKPFFNTLMSNVTGTKIGVGVLYNNNENIVNEFREYLGHTDPLKSEFGTLRGRFGLSIDANSFHGSDSLDSFKRELSLLLPNLVLI